MRPLFLGVAVLVAVVSAVSFVPAQQAATSANQPTGLGPGAADPTSYFTAKGLTPSEIAQKISSMIDPSVSVKTRLSQATDSAIILPGTAQAPLIEIAPVLCDIVLWVDNSGPHASFGGVNISLTEWMWCGDGQDDAGLLIDILAHEGVHLTQPPIEPGGATPLDTLVVKVKKLRREAEAVRKAKAILDFLFIPLGSISVDEYCSGLADEGEGAALYYGEACKVESDLQGISIGNAGVAAALREISQVKEELGTLSDKISECRAAFCFP